MTALAQLTGIVDGATLGGELRLTPEVCIVGSGAGGAVAASVLANAGHDVLVVEEGGHHTKADFQMREDTAFPMLYQEDGGRATEDQAIAILQGRAVGGTTVVNWTTCFRTPDHVVAHWAENHGVRGFSHADLVPHWEEVERRLHVCEIPLAEINRNNRTLWDGCKSLGLDVALLRRNVNGCFRSGYCGMGCPVDAKQSMLVTYLPDAVARGARVLAHCRIDRLETSGRRVVRALGTLLGADGKTPTGATVIIEARRWVLSAGAINTPALLMRSGVLHDGLVGRRTFLHPTFAQMGLYPDKIDAFAGAPQSVASHHFARRGDDVGFVLEAAPIHPMLASLAAPGFGEFHAKTMHQLPNVAAHIALLVDGFHPSETGGTVKLRRSGAPLLDYVLPPRVFAAMREAAKAMARIQLASGATESWSAHDPPLVARKESDVQRLDAAPYERLRLTVFSAHVMGGSAMNDDAKKGVVRSEDLALHALDDVHVVDGSVFPTSLGVNPQLSIYGLAHLVSTRLAAKWKA